MSPNDTAAAVRFTDTISLPAQSDKESDALMRWQHCQQPMTGSAHVRSHVTCALLLLHWPCCCIRGAVAVPANKSLTRLHLCENDSDVYMHHVQVLATGGDAALGGDDVDAALASFIEQKRLRLTAPLTKPQRGQLLAAARSAKEALSSTNKIVMKVGFGGGADSDGVAFAVTQGNLEKACYLLFKRFQKPIEEACIQAGVDLGAPQWSCFKQLCWASVTCLQRCLEPHAGSCHASVDAAPISCSIMCDWVSKLALHHKRTLDDALRHCVRACARADAVRAAVARDESRGKAKQKKAGPEAEVRPAKRQPVSEACRCSAAAVLFVGSPVHSHRQRLAVQFVRDWCNCAWSCSMQLVPPSHLWSIA